MPLEQHAYINLNTQLLCKTTGWENNCGLNCLTHFLYHQLSRGELQKNFSSHPEYQALLKTFQTYYQLPTQPTWDEIKQLLDNYPVPTDKEAIFAPVLRQYLGQKLSNMPEVTWETDAAAAISDYLLNEQVRDVALPLFHANEEFFERLKTKYDRSQRRITSQLVTETERDHVIARDLSGGKEMPSEERIRAQVEFVRANELQDSIREEAKAHWLAEGASRYGEAMGNLDNAAMVSAEQLTLIANGLSIGLEVFTPTSIQDAKDRPEVGKVTHGAQNLPDKAYPMTFRVHNSGIHWEFESPNKDLTQVANHNQYYPETITDDFISNPERTGQFQLFAGNAPLEINQLVKASVHSTLDNLRVRPEPAKGISAEEFKKLELKANLAMNQLVDILDHHRRNGTLNDANQKKLFEFYFNEFEKELEKGPKSASIEKIHTLTEEIHRHELPTMKEHAHIPEPHKNKKPKNR